jgi:hypothetical protein
MRLNCSVYLLDTYQLKNLFKLIELLVHLQTKVVLRVNPLVISCVEIGKVKRVERVIRVSGLRQVGLRVHSFYLVSVDLHSDQLFLTSLFLIAILVVFFYEACALITTQYCCIIAVVSRTTFILMSGWRPHNSDGCYLMPRHLRYRKLVYYNWRLNFRSQKTDCLAYYRVNRNFVEIVSSSELVT